MRMKSLRVLSLSAVVLLAGSSRARAQPLGLDRALDSLATQIGQGIGEAGGKRIAVVEFTDLSGQVDELGSFIAEELVTRLVKFHRFEVIDRRVLKPVLVDEGEELTIAGMLDPEARRELRKVLKLDYLVTGVIAQLEGMVRLNARVIAVETGIITSVATVDVLMDSVVEGLSGVNWARLGPVTSSVRLEGENLKVVSKTGGIFELQYTSRWGNGWSNGAHGWWRETRLGDKLVLALPVGANGRYHITAQLTRANNGGDVQLYLDGRRLGKPFVSYAPNVSVSGVLDFGTARLKAGEHELTVEMVGETKDVVHDANSLCFALDYIQLERVP